VPDDLESDRTSRLKPATIGVVVMAIALALFIVQNTDKTPVNWLFFEWEVPLWLLLVVTSAIAIIAAELAAFVLRHRRER
jgi:uncharacterized integral membrane protein